MLKLEKIELIGFKSFSGRTEVLFPDGITAVVGPNGCGKSNIGDAISWVLGEQSAKSLRGDKMEDVIFNGSQNLKPMGMAEVSLRLVHDNGASGDGQDEIILTRRLFRSGESEYVLNGEKCRLKDISDLLSQSHIGAKTCAVIEQGKVEEIMNARPLERRLIIEEAAGIMGYKGKRRVAEVKLEATKANLLRVQDIVNEVEGQMRSLKRQASRARRFSRLKDTVREKQSILFSRKNRLLITRLSEIDSFLNEIKGKEAGLLSHLGVLEATLERGKQELSQAEENLAKTIEQVHLLDKRINEEESNARNAFDKVIEMESSTTRVLEQRKLYQNKILEMEKSISEKEVEKSNAEQRKQQFQNQIKVYEKDLMKLKEKEALVNQSLEEERERLFKEANILSEMRNSSTINEMERRKLESSFEKKSEEREEEKKNVQEMKESLSLLKERKSKAEQEILILQSQLNDLLKEKDRLDKSLMEKEQDISNLKVLLNSLHEKENIYNSSEVSHEMFDEGIRAILREELTFDIDHSGPVADWIKTEKKYEKAVEGYLIEVLPALCVKSVNDAVNGMRILKEAKAGAGRFLFMTETDPRAQDMEIPEKIRKHEGFLGRLSDKAVITNGIGRKLHLLLNQCILAEDIDSALTFYQWCSYFDYVTPDGEVIRSKEGLAFYNSPEDGNKALLTVKGKLETLRKEIEDVSNEHTKLVKETKESKNEFYEKDNLEKRIREKINELEKGILSLSHDENRLLELIDYGEKKCRIIRDELSVMDEEKNKAKNYLEKNKDAIAIQESEFSKREEEVKRLKQERDHFKEQITKKSKDLSNLYLEYAAPGRKAASLEAELLHLNESMKEMNQRINDSLTEETSGKEKIKSLKSIEEQSRNAVEEMILDKAKAQEAMEQLKNEIASRKDSLIIVEKELKQLRMKVDETRGVLKERELERVEIQGDIKHNSEACYEDLSKRIDELDSQREAHEEINEEALAQEISELKEKIQRIGLINMMAIEEYDKLDERFRFLFHQKKDLTDSIESLKETINKINRTSREKFRQAFQAVREGFNDTFKILFNGGRADLRLEDEIDILESGVEIIAQPPGKKLQNINLLSGGEKALSVIALIFAIFRYRPSSFCLLDEVDSTLDDVNIEKFINMVRGFSDKTQFILITHNKKTMEVANLLYGVTMQEPGVSKLVSLKLN